MNLTIGNVNFEGYKTPRLNVKKNGIKKIKQKQTKEQNSDKFLNSNNRVSSLPIQKMTKLPPNHPDAEIVAKLWQLRFDLQYYFINGSYKEYKNAKKAYAEYAVENYQLLQQVNNPIQIRNSIPVFSKMGRNILKNALLDKLRIKTPAEKKLIALHKEENKQKEMLKILNT